MREILNGIFYILRGGIAWRLLPKDLPPESTVFGYFSRWRDAGVFRRITTIASWKIESGSDGRPRRVLPCWTARA